MNKIRRFASFKFKKFCNLEEKWVITHIEVFN